MGNGENAGNYNFFNLLSKMNFIFLAIYKFLSMNALNLDWPKNLSGGKDLELF